MHLNLLRYCMLALSILGSATLLFSCSNKPKATEYDYETLMTESSENRTIIMMDNGKRSYTFTTPLMEGYSLATNPYQEFRRGIKMTTYTDTLSLVDATITANYAIYYENQKLWEAKGNVIIVKKIHLNLSTKYSPPVPTNFNLFPFRLVCSISYLNNIHFPHGAPILSVIKVIITYFDDKYDILNFDKNTNGNIQKNYIGGATFLEIYDAFRFIRKA